MNLTSDDDEAPSSDIPSRLVVSSLLKKVQSSPPEYKLDSRWEPPFTEECLEASSIPISSSLEDKPLDTDIRGRSFEQESCSPTEECRSLSDPALSMWPAYRSALPLTKRSARNSHVPSSSSPILHNSHLDSRYLVVPKSCESVIKTPGRVELLPLGSCHSGDAVSHSTSQEKPKHISDGQSAKHFCSTYVYSNVVHPVKSGTMFGVFRLWHLIIWIVKRYTAFFINCLRFYLGIYHGCRIVADIYGLLAVHWIGRVGLLRPLRWLGRQLFGGARGRRITMLHRSLAKAETYPEWHSISEQLDEVTGAKEWCCADDGHDGDGGSLYDSTALRSHISAMKQARATGNIPEIMFLLRVCCNRHFCHLRNPSLYSVSFVHTKHLIEDFYDEVWESLDYLNVHTIGEEDDTASVLEENGFGRPPSMLGIGNSPTMQSSFLLTTRELLKFLSALRLSMGRTALCLSGGGALAVYHMGILRSLIEQGMVPKVISGTSGGAISAGAMAIWSDEELCRTFLRPDFLHSRGWNLCPPFSQQLKHLWKTGYLLDQYEYIQLARSMYGEITFSEAFQRTGRFVSITTVPAGRSGPCEPLVCNCINTPDILIWSAVVASCSLPLVLPPTALFTKSRVGPINIGLPGCTKTSRSGYRRNPTHECARAKSPDSVEDKSVARCCTFLNKEAADAISNSNATQSGSHEVGCLASTKVVPDASQANVLLEGGVSRYAPDSMLFVDGSILQDIPHTELQTLFNVKSFVVSQVNPHFTPFVQGPSGYRNEKGALRWFLDQCWSYLALDLRNRYERLLALAIVPNIKGQDVSPFLIQSVEGHVTIVPAPPSEFWKLTSQPSPEGIRRSIKTSQRKLWPYMTRLKHVLMIENKLKQLWVENLRQFEGRQISSNRKLAGRRHRHEVIHACFQSRQAGCVLSAEELLQS